MTAPDGPAAGAAPGNAFPPTRGSLVALARSPDPEERARATAAIAAAYWRPVYTYVRLRWRRSPEDAQDLTQEFFARLVEKEMVAGYDPARARLRTFLRVAIDRLVANAGRDGRRLKRGGGVEPLPLDLAAAEGDVARLEPPTAEDAEAFFEREWSRWFLRESVAAARAECERRGKLDWFRLFARYDLEEGPAVERPSYADLAREQGIAVTDVTNRLFWVRREFRRIALARLRELTVSDDEFRLEARGLLGIEPR